MTVFSRDILPRGTTYPEMPSSLLSFGQSGKAQIRSTQQVGRRWVETYPVMKMSDPTTRKFLAQIQNLYRNRVIFDTDCRATRVLLGTGAGTPVVNGVSQVGANIITNGWTASQLVLKQGDVVQFGTISLVYDVTGDVTADGSGNATIPINPPIYAGGSPVNGVAVVINSPAGTVHYRVFIERVVVPSAGPDEYMAGLQLHFCEAPASSTPGGALPPSALFKYTAGDALTGWTTSRAGAAMYRQTNAGAGTLASASSGVMRDSHYETPAVSTQRTWLLEGQSTNLLQQSESLGTSPSNVNGATVTNNSTTAPDGNVTAAKVAGDGTNGPHNVYQDCAGITASTTYTFSFYVKPGSLSWVRAQYYGHDAVAHKTYFNASTGAFGTIDGSTTARVEAAANGFYRVMLTLGSGAGATTPQLTVGLASADGTDSFLAQTTDYVYAWGLMAELGSTASSYTKTTTAVVTRVADSAQITYTATPQNQTVYAKFIERGTRQMLGEVVYLGSAANSSGARLYLGSDGSNYRFSHHNGTAQVTSTLATAPAFGDSVELRGVLYADGSVQCFISINGAAEVSATASAANTLAGSWVSGLIWLNSGGSGNTGQAAFLAAKIGTGTQTLAQMRAL